MRLPRSDKEYGGGSGKTTLNTGMFEVTQWCLQRGFRTTVTCKHNTSVEMNFDGHIDFTEQKCIEQLTSDELLSIINYQVNRAFDAGMKAKSTEIKIALGIIY